MIYEKINSLQLHLNHGAEEIIETECLQDVACGIYPCFYLRDESRLKVSTSVTSLIFNSGKFEINRAFRPPDFLEMKKKNKLFLEVIWILKRAISLSSLGFYKPTPYQVMNWYQMWETIDRRIGKLQPFETIMPEGKNTNFQPDFSIKDKDVIIRKATYYLKDFINNVEDSFPDYHHVVMVGGKDSQLICLAPKRDDNKWHVFSAEPNFLLVKEWLKKNEININKLFFHDNQNEENLEDFKRKVIVGDLFANPADMKWLPTLKKIAESFDYKCVFWAGTMSALSHFFHGTRTYYSGDKRKLFFTHHINQTSSWQGNYHQIFKNFVGCPLLSPYHSEEIWEELFKHIDPIAITRKTDMREKIGELLFGKSIEWINKNPGPEVYSYNFKPDLYSLYVEYIQDRLSY